MNLSVRNNAIYILYTPRTVLRPLPFSFGKGSEAALIVHVTEHRGGPAEHGRARGSHGKARGSAGGARPSTVRGTGSAALTPICRSRFGAQGSHLGPRLQLPSFSLIRFSQPAAWETFDFPISRRTQPHALSLLF